MFVATDINSFVLSGDVLVLVLASGDMEQSSIPDSALSAFFESYIGLAFIDHWR